MQTQITNDVISTGVFHAKSQIAAAVGAWAEGREIVALLLDIQTIFPSAPPPAPTLTPQSAEGVIKAAYLKAIRAVHPDKVSHLNKN
jgi:hypothetical protein